jgi:hypothetical protein
MCHLSRKSPEAVEVFCDQTLPYGAFVRLCIAIHSGHDSLRSQRFCRSVSRSGLTRQKEKQGQKDEEEKDFEKPPQKAQSQACVDRIS